MFACMRTERTVNPQDKFHNYFFFGGKKALLQTFFKRTVQSE